MHLLGLLGDSARDVGNGVRHRLATGAQQARGLRQRVELTGQTRHGAEERRAQIVNMQRGRQMIGEPANQHRLFLAVGVRLVMFNFEDADIAIAEPERDGNRRARLGAHMLNAGIFCGVDNEHRLPGAQRHVAQGGAIDFRRHRYRQQADAALIRYHLATAVDAGNAKVAPINHPVGEHFDPLNGFGKSAIARHDLFHRQNRIQLFGRDRLSDNALDQQTGKPDDEQHDDGPQPAKHLECTNDDADGGRSRATGQNLIPENEGGFFRVEFASHDEREVQQSTTQDEMRQQEQRHRGDKIRPFDSVRTGAQRHRAPRKNSVRSEQRQRLAAGIDPRHTNFFAQHQPVAGQHTKEKRERRRSRSGNQGAAGGQQPEQIERAVLGDGQLIAPEQHGRKE